MMLQLRLLVPVLLAVAGNFVLTAAAAPLIVPGHAAYSVPDPGGLRMKEDQGIIGWEDPAQSARWFGSFKQAGGLSVKVRLNLLPGTTAKFRLTVENTAREVTVGVPVSAGGTGTGTGGAVAADFGTFTLTKSGYHLFTLTDLNPPGHPPLAVEALELEGPAVAGAHFNLKERRNAASVHLGFETPAGAEITAFYSEVTAVEDPVQTYYMACGFSRGYFGMQVNSPTERRIIFSVWDAGSGSTAIDRTTVAAENHTSLLAKGAGVQASVFGNEGTGGHSHLKYNWKTGTVQKFVVTAQPQGSFTDYTGYWFHPEANQWKLLARFHAPQDGKYLRGLYSFSENFSGETGHLVRKARFGNQWIQTSGGPWSELTSTAFSHDATGKTDRLDRFMGVEDGQFFLSHGGYVDGFTAFGQSFTRPGGGKAPALTLPAVP